MNNLRTIREKRGFSQSEVAKRISEITGLKIKQQNIQLYENKENLPREIIGAYMQLFGVSSDYLLGFASSYEPITPNASACASYLGLSEKSLEVLRRFHVEDEHIFKENLTGLNYILETLHDKYEGKPYEYDIENNMQDISQMDCELIHAKLPEESAFQLMDDIFKGNCFVNIDEKNGLVTMSYPKGFNHPVIADIESAHKETLPQDDTFFTLIYKFTHVSEYFDLVYGLYNPLLNDMNIHMSPLRLWSSIILDNIHELLISNREDSTEELEKKWDFWAHHTALDYLKQYSNTEEK